ncbi:MAG: hypothetical protein JSV55_00460 [Deltaproteobacteria bacterium]|nr:MAG: hypothetical protein JSV55_00460 [Deltaproteobacteria bacterium]
MKQLMRALMMRLAGKGMEVSDIPAYIRNVANTIVAHPNLGIEELDGYLHNLGWKNVELDNYTFMLILATFEPELLDDLGYRSDGNCSSTSSWAR